MTKPSDVLQSIADVLLCNPEMHIKGLEAISQTGGQVLPTDSDACRWCALGFLNVAVVDLDERNVSTLYSDCHQLFIRANNIVLISQYNDRKNTTVDMIQKAFQKAADLAYSQERK